MTSQTHAFQQMAIQTYTFDFLRLTQIDVQIEQMPNHTSKPKPPYPNLHTRNLKLHTTNPIPRECWKKEVYHHVFH